MKKKLSLILIVFTLAVSLSCGIILSVSAEELVNNGEETISQVTIDDTQCYVKGASIRFHQDEQELINGSDLRFEFNLKKDIYDKLTNPKFSVLISKNGGEKYTEFSVEDKYIFHLEGNTIGKVYLYNIPTADYNKDIALKVKVQADNLNTPFTSKPLFRSIAYVANAALNDPKETFTQEQERQLQESIPATLVRSFDASSEVDYIYGRYGKTEVETEWVESLKDEAGIEEHGIAKINLISKSECWPGVKFDPVLPMKKYIDNFKTNANILDYYIGMRMYFPNDLNGVISKMSFTEQYENDKDYAITEQGAKISNNLIRFGNWVTYRLPIGLFLKYWQDDNNVKDNEIPKLQFFLKEPASGKSFYISDISIGKRDGSIAIDFAGDDYIDIDTLSKLIPTSQVSAIKYHESVKDKNGKSINNVIEFDCSKNNTTSATFIKFSDLLLSRIKSTASNYTKIKTSAMIIVEKGDAKPRIAFSKWTDLSPSMLNNVWAEGTVDVNQFIGTGSHHCITITTAPEDAKRGFLTNIYYDTLKNI